MSSTSKAPERDVAHRPFAVLLASAPPSQTRRTINTGFVSLVIHTAIGAGMIWATAAMATETEDEEEPEIVELIQEMENVPPPPPPPPDVEAPMPEVITFQTLQVPTVILSDLPPPAASFEFRASDFTGQGVAANDASGRDSTEVSADIPTFTPMTQRPELLNADEVTRVLVREYPALLRDAGVGGTVVVWIYLDTQGAVQNTKVNVTSGYDQLDVAALAVANTMRFTPAYNRDQKVPVWVQIPVTFRVDN